MATGASVRRYSTLGKATVIGLFGFAGWLMCAAIMVVGRMYLPMWNTLILHAIGAPITFAVLSAIYFERFGFTSPLRTAVIFATIVVGIETCVVAPVLVGDFSMFGDALKTWIPFALIFAATYLTGLVASDHNPRGA